MKIIKPIILCSVVLITSLMVFFLIMDWSPIPIFGGGVDLLAIPIIIAISIGKRIADKQVQDWQLFAKVSPAFFILSFLLSFYLMPLFPNSNDRNETQINSITEPLKIRTSTEAQELISDDVIHSLTNSAFFDSSYTEARVKIDKEQVNWILWNCTGFKFKRYIIDAKTGERK